jgi:hypothetical protein
MTQFGLDDPDQAHHAWGRFRNIMAWMIAAAGAASAVTIIIMEQLQGPIRMVTKAAILGGVGGSVLLAGALMGLVFLSSGTGHDEDVERYDPMRDYRRDEP